MTEYTVKDLQDLTVKLREINDALDADAVVLLAFKKDNTKKGDIDCLTDYYIEGLTPAQVGELTVGAIPHLLETFKDALAAPVPAKSKTEVN